MVLTVAEGVRLMAHGRLIKSTDAVIRPAKRSRNRLQTKSKDAAVRPAKRSRNRLQTETEILDALETVLMQRGFDELGINTVAQESGFSKELIYRYFGGLPGLVSEWVDRRDYWSLSRIRDKSDVFDESKATTAEIMSQVLRTFASDIRNNRHMQEIRRWEISSRSELALQIASKREESGMRLITAIPSSDEDNIAVYAILQAGFCYLLLRAAQSPTYCGVSLTSDDGWSRLQSAADRIITALYPSETDRPLTGSAKQATSRKAVRKAPKEHSRTPKRD